MKRYIIGRFNESSPLGAGNDARAAGDQTCGSNYLTDAAYRTAPSYHEHVDTGNLSTICYISVSVPEKKVYRLGLPRFDFETHRRMNHIPFDLLHCHSPFSIGRFVLRRACRKGIPVVADFRSKYCEDFIRAGHYSAIAQLMTKYLMRFYSAADEVWIPQPNLEAALRRYGYKGRVTVVENDDTETTEQRYIRIIRRKADELSLRRRHVPWPERIWPEPIFELNGQLA